MISLLPRSWNSWVLTRLKADDGQGLFGQMFHWLLVLVDRYAGWLGGA